MLNQTNRRPRVCFSLKEVIMVKRLLLCFFIFAMLFLCSCHSPKYDILKYQNKKICAECTLNDEYKISIKKDGEKREISFLAPVQLSHVSFEIYGESIVGRASELEIPFNCENVRGIFAISNIFSLSEECLSSACAQDDGAEMEFTTEYGTYKLLLGKNELPCAVQIYSSDYRFNISIDAITLY